MTEARSKSWLADRIRAAMPSREQLERNPLLRPVAHRLLHPALWRFTRRSVPRAIALGLFVGIFLLIPFVQFVAAALVAVPFRANVPLTAGTTLLSNPVTTPLIMVASLWVGNLLFGLHADLGAVTAMIHHGATIGEWCRWLLSDAAPALLAGLFVISVGAAAIGYLGATLLWRWWVARKWRSRARRPRVVPLPAGS